MARALPLQTTDAERTSHWEFDVRFCETDLMGIVHHSRYLQYFEAARVAWLKRRGIDYLEWAAEGIHVPVVEVGLRYQNASRFDDRLSVATTLSRLTRATILYEYVITRPADGANICKGSTLLACVKDGMRPVGFPMPLLEALQRPDGDHGKGK